MDKDKKWSLVIEPQTSLFAMGLAEHWKCRDLCAIFIKRDIITIYNKTGLCLR